MSDFLRYVSDDYFEKRSLFGKLIVQSIMNLKNKIRKLLFSNLSEREIENFYRVYYRLRYPDELMKKMSYGELNPDKTFFLIRPRKDCTEGLLSLFWNVIRNIDFALEKNYIPIVDFKNYRTQYSMSEKENVWNYYFTQPSRYSLEEVYRSKNVIISGLETQNYKPDLYKANYSEDAILHFHNFIFDIIDFSESIKEKVYKELDQLKIDNNKTIGLYLRGTDYLRLKPSGHPVQPTVEQAIKVVEQFQKKYDIDNIYLVTEDGEIHDEIIKRFGDICVTPSFDKYIYNYSGKQYLSHDSSINELESSPKQRGEYYLIKIMILSKCSYLIGGNTNGTWAACAFAGNTFTEKYIFDLGVYGK